MAAHNDPHDKIHAEMFARINKIESKVDETNGYLRGVVESNERVVAVNEQLLALINKRDKSQARIMWALMSLLFFTIGVIAFGAIGKDGMHSVRQVLPSMPLDTAAILPHPDGLDKWRNRS